jgi:hypothetical protein
VQALRNPMPQHMGLRKSMQQNEHRQVSLLLPLRFAGDPKTHRTISDAPLMQIESVKPGHGDAQPPVNAQHSAARPVDS